MFKSAYKRIKKESATSLETTAENENVQKYKDSASVKSRMTTRSILKQNQFIEIDGKYYYIVNVDTDNIGEFLDFDGEFLDLNDDSWYSCLDSKGHRITIFDPDNSSNFGIVHRKWIGSDEIYNTFFDKIRDWLYYNKFIDFLHRIMIDLSCRRARDFEFI